MLRLARFYASPIGKKVVVALTGLVLFGFVVGHMIGNLKVFAGNDADGVPHIDHYAESLRSMGEPMFAEGQFLWLVRGILLLSLVLHVVAVFRMALQNSAARRVRYAVRANIQASRAARWMTVTGGLILMFVVMHILHFTTGTIDSSSFVEGAVYGNLHRGFSVWYYPLIYVGAMCVLALHVHHGVWSAFQTLGLDNPDRNRALRLCATIASLALLVGFASVPVMFFFGAMPVPPPS